MGNGSSASASATEARARQTRVKSRLEPRQPHHRSGSVDRHDTMNSAGAVVSPAPSPSPSHYQRQQSHSRTRPSSPPSTQQQPREYLHPRHAPLTPPPLSPSTISLASTRVNSADLKQARLLALREGWKKETAKRIHVVVRVRPLMYNEIKHSAKVIIDMTKKKPC